ncbi:MAG TPA: quinate 5-dehydrogenase [bacterium]|nr:quinate 5-dehydrogenase [bacterium]
MSAEKEQKHVISVSIGSSKRNHSIDTEIMGIPFKIERKGTDGDMAKAIEQIKELDGTVDAIGLGGIDLYLNIGKKRYVLQEAKKLADAAKKTPTYDGSTLKNSIEREFVRQLREEGVYLKQGTRVLVVSAADRYGMAEAIAQTGADFIFGDLMFTLGLPIPIKKLSTLNLIVAILLPVVSRLPFEMIYPTGEKQEKRTPKYGRYFKWAEVIAGDFNYINRYVPDDLTGKILLTNTVTSSDVDDMRARGVSTLITTTPDFGGRSFGTNVMEGVYSTILGKTVDDPPTEEEFMQLVRKADLKPRILKLND